MARTCRTAIGSLKDELYQHPYRFEFFQAVRLLWLIRGKQKGCCVKQIGEDALPDEEPVRLKGDLSHHFPNADVSEIETESPDSIPKLAVSAMGLYGAMGVLPTHDTQRLIDMRRSTGGEVAFLDLFNHRILSLFYRAWAKHSLPTNYERTFHRICGPTTNLSDLDVISCSLLSLAGVGLSSLRNQVGFPDTNFAFFAGHFSRNPKSASSLEQMLLAVFKVRALVTHFVGQWFLLNEATRSEMASPDRIHGQNATLGTGFILGDRVWDTGSRFRVTLGPLSYAQMLSFCPWNKKLEQLSQFVRSYVGHHLEFDVQLELDANQTPVLELCGEHALGVNSWLFYTLPTENSKDAVFVQTTFGSTTGD